MSKNQSESNNLMNAKIYFLPNRLHINLKEAIQILNKPLATERIECSQLELKSGKWYIFIEYNEPNKISDGIEWKETGTTLLPNEKNPMVIAKYFSSEKLYKSVFKLRKKIEKNKYEASLVNYTSNLPPLDVGNDIIQKIRSRVSKKKSIKNIMKERFAKMKNKENFSQNRENS